MELRIADTFTDSFGNQFAPKPPRLQGIELQKRDFLPLKAKKLTNRWNCPRRNEFDVDCFVQRRRYRLSLDEVVKAIPHDLNNVQNVPRIFAKPVSKSRRRIGLNCSGSFRNFNNLRARANGRRFPKRIEGRSS